MTLLTKSKNPLRDYRKAVVAVMVKYFDVEADSIRLRVKPLSTHRALGDSPAYVALTIGKALNLPQALTLQRRRRR